MSTLKATIVEVDIEAHPNADRLDVARPRGKDWQCVVQKDSFKTGDKAVYFPIDSVLPEPLVEKLGIANYYSKRLRTIRLRNLISQGMCAPMHLFPEFVNSPIGYDVTEILSVTKYEPPIPIHMAGMIRKHDGRFIKYVEIENYKNYPDVFKEGENVVIREKIHGTNGRAAKIDGEIHVGSHNMNLIEDEKNLYWRAANKLGVKDKLEEGEQVFFEPYGKGIQDLTYSVPQNEVGVAIFDVMKDGKYLSEAEFLTWLMVKGWSSFVAPSLYTGLWSKGLLKLADGKSRIDGKTTLEGFVITPEVETVSVELQGRKILKVISDTYLLRKGATERH